MTNHKLLQNHVDGRIEAQLTLSSTNLEGLTSPSTCGVPPSSTLHTEAHNRVLPKQIKAVYFNRKSGDVCMAEYIMDRIFKAFTNVIERTLRSRNYKLPSLRFKPEIAQGSARDSRNAHRVTESKKIPSPNTNWFRSTHFIISKSIIIDKA